MAPMSRRFFRPRHPWTVLGLLLLGFLAVGCGEPAPAGSGARGVTPRDGLRIAAASDLQFAMDDLEAGFMKAGGKLPLQSIFASSGTLFSQITNRAPFDLFLSADMAYAQQVHAEGLSHAGGPFEYAVGRIAVWVPRGSPLDPVALGINTLTHPSVEKIAIAHPEHAHYGRAAVAAMKALGVYGKVGDRLVIGESVAQAAYFVQSGAADAGLVAQSLAAGPKRRGKSWVVPQSAHDAIRHGGVVLASARHPEEALKFRDFLTGPAGRGILKRLGFSLPGAG